MKFFVQRSNHISSRSFALFFGGFALFFVSFPPRKKKLPRNAPTMANGNTHLFRNPSQKSSCTTKSNFSNMCGDDNEGALCLAPLRHGQVLFPTRQRTETETSKKENNNNKYSHADNDERQTLRTSTSTHPWWIPLSTKEKVNKNKSVILGRIDLMSCAYAACGCSQKVFSTKGKCKEFCQMLNRWAVSSLSRQTLRIQQGNILSVRGDHTKVIVNDPQKGQADVIIPRKLKRKNVDTMDKANTQPEWFGDKKLTTGMNISICPLDGVICHRLDFTVTTLTNLSRVIRSDSTNIPFERRMTEQSNTSAALSRQTTSSQSQGDRAAGQIAFPLMRQQTITSQQQEPVVVRLWFFPMGQDLPKKRIKLLSKRAEALGVHVVSNFWEATHVVVSGQIPSLQHIVSSSTFKEKVKSCPSLEKVQNHFDSKGVCCVLPSWVVKIQYQSQGQSQSTFLSPFSKPSILDQWPGYAPVRNRKRKTREVLGNEGGGTQFTFVPKRARIQRTTTPPTRGISSHIKNLLLSELFLEVSKIYEEAPLFPEDAFRAYTFHRVSGRLLSLSFDILSNPSYVSGLKDVPGFNSSAITMIQQYVDTKSMERMERLRNDPMRVAMKHLMSIWGMGRATALDLIQQGYRTIEDVRKGLGSDKLKLTRNQLVGLDCYDDLQERMERGEVEEIGKIVIDTFNTLDYPTAAITIMGSYRRGKPTSGDIDVLISMKEYPNSIPSGALQELVDLLCSKGHMAYHLTYLPGLTTGVEYLHEGADEKGTPVPIGASQQPSKRQSSDIPLERKSSREESQPSSSYMGVFHSPRIRGKRRRIDIKIYPYSMRPFASLYFTGNAQFNRSMRLWAKQKFQWTLNDKGLVDSTGKSVFKRDGKYLTEKDVFEKLRLCYKAPTERKCFDDVVPLDQASS